MYPSNSGEKTIEMLRNVAKKTKSPVAKELLKDQEFGDACSLAHQLFYEAMDEFKEGEMTWKEAIDDLHANLGAMEMPKQTKKESEGE